MSKVDNKGILKYDHTGDTFPFVSIISAKLVPGYKIIVRKGLEEPELTIVTNSETIKGNYLTSKYLARTTSTLYGQDALSATHIDYWIQKGAHISSEKVEQFVGELNDHLTLRTFVVGFNLSLADIVLFARTQLFKPLKDELAAKSKTLPHIHRWLNYLLSLDAFKETVAIFSPAEKKPVAKATKDTAATTTASTTSTSTEEPKKGLMGWAGNFEKLALPDLIEGKVRTRFPPEPSGYMHIGHCKAAVLNNYYATQYKGSIILRFDDTNPTKEKDEFVVNIIKDLNTIGINFEKTTNTSDYFELLMDYGEKLITTGNGYVDNTNKEEISKQREEGRDSVCRSHTVEKNLEWWAEMKKGSEFGQTCVLRAKIDMNHPDRAFRDPAMYRVSMTPHHKTGDKYKVYPLYDFACPIVDSIEGVTHALRSNEYQNKVNLYYWVTDIFGLRRPYVSDYSRLSFTHVLLSKRKLQQFVDAGIVNGWTDPRLPTLQGIMRRGLTIEALKEFVLSQGASSVNTTMDIGKLWAINKIIVEPNVPRFTAIPAKKNVLVTIQNIADDKVEKIQKLKFDKKPELGEKTLTTSNKVHLEYDDVADITVGEEVTLMGWGMNIIIRDVKKAADGTVESITADANPTGSFKDTKKRFTYLSSTTKKIPVILQDFGPLIDKPKLEEDDILEEHINKVTKWELEAFSDENILSLKVGDKLQFERRGLYNVDQVGSETTPFVMIYIPDGTTKFKPGEALHPFIKREEKNETIRVKPSSKQQQKKN
ncbi:glutamate-tRNA ligase [Cavenderia fasciculata]|uniref:glutamate--tRNA ligase n=1 Tax=Cavenderia fasciculata TaxID=261658 RepID=F4QE83_CACFS|nr:glutamate-tRNA ligase [Cavenderia fasciculata]EGG14030.1 glutamate-tRNA ligase [Cavenderia fasciculata]|eukprot:XP_004350738.1 glutamate-tRNA ligase [Cavenderia fasciculata]